MVYKLNYNSFYSGLKEGKLLGLKCSECGAYTIPPKKVCFECTSDSIEIVEASGKGEIVTFTVIRVPQEGYPPNSIIALVKLEEGPWVMANIENLELEQATLNLIGRKVVLGHKNVPADAYSAGERVAMTFSLA